MRVCVRSRARARTFLEHAEVCYLTSCCSCADTLCRFVFIAVSVVLHLLLANSFSLNLLLSRSRWVVRIDTTL